MSITNDSVTNGEATNCEERLIGRVKWFNNKAGYGFITVTDGSMSGNDIFTHHSSIVSSSQQYKYLVQGEYVEFVLSKTQNNNHEFQASNVSGIKGGKLMCETRNELKNARNTYNKTVEKPSTNNNLEAEWSDVKSKPKPNSTPKPKSTPKPNSTPKPKSTPNANANSKSTEKKVNKKNNV
jgi:cold shock CspA family protein